MLIEKIKGRFGAEILTAQNERDEETFTIDREHAYDFFRALRDEPDFQFNFLTDLTAVDWLDRKPRFDVVYHLLKLAPKPAGVDEVATPARMRVLCGVEENEPLPSVMDMWKSADWAEREVFDLFGIVFEGHADLRRIQMPHDWEGHPLRKDYEFPLEYHGIRGR